MGITLYLQGDKLVGEGIPIDIDEDRCDIILEREPSARMIGRASNSVVVSPKPNNVGTRTVDTLNWHKNVVLYYSFEQADPFKVIDASGNGNHGRIRGARYTKAHAGGKGMAFDGQRDYISTPGIHLQCFTFSAAVKPQRAGGSLNNPQLFLLDGDKGYYALQANVLGTLGFFASIHGGKARIVEDDMRPQIEDWTTVAVTCDGSTVELYRDGELAGQGRILGDDVAGTAYIGGADAHNSPYWHGLMDEVVLFNRPLAAEEIRELHRITAVQELHHHLTTPEQQAFSDELIAAKVPEMSGDVVLYYSFNEDYGDEVLDNSGRGHHAHAHGAKYVSDGRSGRSLSFDGQDDYLSTPDIHLDNFTFSAFVKTLLPANKPNTNNRRLFLLCHGPHYYALQGNSAGSIGLDLTGHRGVDEYSWKFEANTWTHIAVTYDRPVVKLYKNGKLTEAGSVDSDGVRGTLYIGGTEKHWGRYWHGLTDEVAVFNRALTQQEIEELYLMVGQPGRPNLR